MQIIVVILDKSEYKIRKTITKICIDFEASGVDLIHAVS